MRHRPHAAIAVSVAAAALVLAPVAALPALAVDAPSTVRINEIESDAPAGGPDWVELYNAGEAAVDISGWILRDDKDADAYAVPAGTTIAAHGFYVFDDTDNGTPKGFGLGKADQARLFLPDGTTLVDGYSWTAHATVTYGRCADGTGEFVDTVTATKGAANDCPATEDPGDPADPGDPGDPPAVPDVVINEVESNGDNTDWVELYNNGVEPVDISGWILRDNKDADAFAAPAGTTIPARGYWVFDDTDNGTPKGFGLGNPDSARLFLPDGTTLVDSYEWDAHATTTYGRCPDGTGEFVTTAGGSKGVANNCGPTGPGTSDAVWPGGTEIATLDAAGTFGGDLSGLAYEASAAGAASDVLWAVQNGDGLLYKLVPDGSGWQPASGDWADGKALHYPGGTGTPDSEGVALTDAGAAGGVYVSTERDNAVSGVSRPAVLRFDVSGQGTALSATQEWDLTSDLPVVGANSGLEGIAWIPDSFLTAHGFIDSSTGSAYRPSDYPGHGTGLFFVVLEADGTVYGYALNADGGYQRVATIASGEATRAELEFDPERGGLWAVCDEACSGRTALLQIAESGPDAGRFTVAQRYERPAGMPNIANEGFAIAPQSRCVDGVKGVYYADDADTDGHSLRAGTIACTALPSGGDGGSEPGDGGSTPGDGGSQPGGGSTPQPVDQAQLTDAHRGAVSAPSSVKPGDTITIAVGPGHEGESVDGWIYSTPVHLGTRTVVVGGISVTIPADLVPGAHRIAVVAADGTLLGWTDITVTAASDPASLASTGSDPALPIGLAVLLLAAGAGVLLLRRRAV